MKDRLEKLPGEPITIWTAYEDWDWVRDIDEANQRVLNVWNKSPEKIYHIVNVSNIKFNIQDLMFSSSNAAHGEEALWGHPKVKMVIVVTQDPLILSAIENMVASAKSSQAVYVQVQLMAVDSVDKALAYIREQRMG